MGTTRMVSVDYMLANIAAGDGRGRGDQTALTRYYTADGYPPGRWMGAGLAGLADGLVKVDAEVTELHLRALFEQAVDSTTGGRLGKTQQSTEPERNELFTGLQGSRPV